MRRSLGIGLVIACAFSIVVVAGYFALYVFAKPQQYVSLGVPIRQDDFTYTVTAVRKAPTLGVGARRVTARGVFYIITVRLDNQALRVPFEWDDSIVYIVDAFGRRHEIDPRAQAIIQAQSPIERSVPAGSQASFETVFDLPKDIQRPAVAFENGILMGDAFNGVAYRRIAVAIQ